MRTLHLTKTFVLPDPHGLVKVINALFLLTFTLKLTTAEVLIVETGIEAGNTDTCPGVLDTAKTWNGIGCHVRLFRVTPICPIALGANSIDAGTSIAHGGKGVGTGVGLGSGDGEGSGEALGLGDGLGNGNGSPAMNLIGPAGKFSAGPSTKFNPVNPVVIFVNTIFDGLVL